MRSCVRCVSCGRLWTVDGGSMSPEEPGRSTGTPAGVERMTRRDVMSRMSITVVMAKIARVTAVTLTLAVGLAAPGRPEAQSAAHIRNENSIDCAQAFENPAATLGAAVCVRNDDVSTRSQGDTVSSAMVLMWNEHAMTAIANSQIRTGGARQTRAGAMVQAAVHDALNAIDHRYEPYAIDFTAPANASADAAVAAAAHDTLLGMFPYEQTTLDALYDASLAGIADGQSKMDGIWAGQNAAAAILAARANDNSAPNTSYTYGEPAPGVYQSTPPNFPG